MRSAELISANPRPAPGEQPKDITMSYKESSAADAAAKRALENEQTVLGALLINRTALDLVDDILEPRHFAEPVHQRIYAKMLELHRDKVDDGPGIKLPPLAEYFLRNDPFSDGDTQWFGRVQAALSDLRVPLRLATHSFPEDPDRGYWVTLICAATTNYSVRKYAQIVRGDAPLMEAA